MKFTNIKNVIIVLLLSGCGTDLPYDDAEQINDGNNTRPLTIEERQLCGLSDKRIIVEIVENGVSVGFYTIYCKYGYVRY